ncbi:MAG TPA: hypothetical protein VKV04_04410 [Verrucomicrobiae bacterium]|nr:hypothetical protein [Verrucomicrobiae bacterium]
MSIAALVTFVALYCHAQTKIVPDPNPAHALINSIVVSSNPPSFAVNGYVSGISWNPSPDTNVIATRIYAGPDTDTPFLMFQIPVPGTNTSFFWPASGSFQVWATAVDSVGEESDISNVFTFVSPPPPTNIVLSWSPPRTNVWIEGSDDLVNWIGITNVDGTNAVLSITNAPFQFYDAVTTDLPPITLKWTLQ